MHPGDRSTTCRQAALPVRQAAAAEIHKKAVSKTGQLTGRYLAVIAADRIMDTATG